MTASPVTSFDPFHAGFCTTTDGEPQCNFENQSGEIINSLSQIFSNPPSSFTGPNTLSCGNEISPDSCNTGPHSLYFFALGIPFTEGGDSTTLFGPVNTDPDFNILYFGFTDNGLADIANSRFVPEPASMGLMLSGLFGIGLALRRRLRRR